MPRKIINDPTPGQKVMHGGWGQQSSKQYPCEVTIVSGNYLVGGRLSNWWTWTMPDGTEVYGYGDFYINED